jgi:hypothetical protein
MRDTSEGTVIWSCVINEWALGHFAAEGGSYLRIYPEQHPKHEVMRL